MMPMINEFEKNKRVYPIPYVPKSDKNNVIKLPIVTPPVSLPPPIKDGWESIDAQNMDNEGPSSSRVLAAASVRRVPRWPDSGVAIPSPAAPDVPEKYRPTQEEILEAGEALGLDFERTSIDKDDQNDWGGIEASIMNGLEHAQGLIDRDQIGTEAEDIKYGPGHYPTEDEEDGRDHRTAQYYHNLFTDQQEMFGWIIPDVLAAGPHPLFASHQDTLNDLKLAGFKAIVSVCDKPLDAEYRKGFHYLFQPTVEGFSSGLAAVCKFIEAQEELGNPVFVHSLKGSGRAATVLAAYLMHKKYLTGTDEAIQYVRQHYDKTAVETQYQTDALLKFSLD